MIVGVLGGMGPAATVDFYHKLIAATPADTDQDHLTVVIWADPTVPDRSEALVGHGPDPTACLRRGITRLREAGAELLAVPCNTAHAFVPPLAEECGLRLVSILDATAAAVQAYAPTLHRVGLLATTGTVRSGLYHRALEPYDVEVRAPDDTLQRRVMSAIADVKAGRPDAARPVLAAAVRTLRAGGAQAVIAGCTEIMLAIGRERHDVPVLDPAEFLAREVVRIATG
jgi:aspartate racemase